MAETYVTKYGVDWPADMHPVLIDLTVAKKHRMLAAEHGIVVPEPWEALLSACRTLFTPTEFVISPWTEQHAHDFVRYNFVVTWGSAASSKSNDYGLFALLDWIVDPYDTVWLVGSTTMKDLHKRTWESVARYFATLQNNALGLSIPGRLDERQLTVSNVPDPSIPKSMTSKAGISGVALDEKGRLQGAHLPFVRVLVDELAEIADHESIGRDVANLMTATTDFRFFGLANPGAWGDAGSRYCLPPKGVHVDVDTGFWMSSMGYAVRHHDGLKSPCVLDPSKEKLYPHLMKQFDVDQNLKQVDGNADAPRIWQMVRGFPQPGAQSVPTVLDAKVAAANRCGAALEPGPWRRLGCAMGIDPAWSEGGDDAVAAVPAIVEVYGKPTLDYTGRVFKLPILASSPVPVTGQLREHVCRILNTPDGPRLLHTAVDSSGNQGLADDLDMFVGGGCMHVNSSVRASENILRAAGDPRPAKEVVYDRGTEAWTILAEFCRAGQVRGLPEQALVALTSRRFATRGKDKIVANPVRLESKDDFAMRFKGSPNDADACALAALAARERLGFIPFGGLPPPQIEGMYRGEPPREPEPLFRPEDGGYEPEFHDTYEPW